MRVKFGELRPGSICFHGSGIFVRLNPNGNKCQYNSADLVSMMPSIMPEDEPVDYFGIRMLGNSFDLTQGRDRS